MKPVMLAQASFSDFWHPSCAGRADSTSSIEEPLTPGRTERSSSAAGEQVIIILYDVLNHHCCLFAACTHTFCNHPFHTVLRLHNTGISRSEMMTGLVPHNLKAQEATAVRRGAHSSPARARTTPCMRRPTICSRTCTSSACCATGLRAQSPAQGVSLSTNLSNLRKGLTTLQERLICRELMVPGYSGYALCKPQNEGRQYCGDVVWSKNLLCAPAASVL